MLGIVLSGGGNRCAYATGAMLALPQTKLNEAFFVGLSGGVPPMLFRLAGLCAAMRDWPRLFDDTRYVSFARLGGCGVLNIDYLVDGILKA